MTSTASIVAGVDAKLTQNEYKLVALLGLHAGKVLTYDYLIKGLWGPSARSDNQILRVNMANIRRKIEKIRPSRSISSPRPASAIAWSRGD